MSHDDTPIPSILSYALFLGVACIKLHFLTSTSTTSDHHKHLSYEDETKKLPTYYNRKDEDTSNMITQAEQIDIYRWKRSRHRLSFDHTSDRNRGRQRHLTFHKHFETNTDYKNTTIAGTNDDASPLNKPYKAITGTTIQSTGVRNGYDCLEDMLSEQKKKGHMEEFSRHDPVYHQGTSFSSIDDYNDSEIAEITSMRPNLNETQSFESESIMTPRSGYDDVKLQWRKRIMPNRLVMVRHGESEGNVNEIIYSNKADSDISLTKLGWEQSRAAGEALKKEVFYNANDKTCQSVHFIVSPYVRTIETFHGIASAWCDPDVEFGHIEDPEKRKIQWYDRLASLGVTWHEDPRIREQDWGNYQKPEDIEVAKKERYKFGIFYYRFPNGESASDVYDRVSTFLDSLWRSFDTKRCQNYVLVTHGISIRVILSRYFRYSIDQFNLLANPKNCEMVILGHDGSGKLQLEGRCEVTLKEDEEDKKVSVSGYKFHQKLRTVPSHYTRTRSIRLSSKSLK